MIRWLIDTNVISEMRRPRPAKAVVDWIAGIELDCLFTSSLNIAELRLGILGKNTPAEAQHLELWVENTIRPWFSGRVAEIGEAVFLRWRVLARQMQVKQLPAPATDLLIAATALEHSLHVATRDVKPFLGTGVPVLNPWTGECFNGA
ncbi:MAG: type II toxin-antitoxin system VapC family toxin [Aestuariivirga sp.]